MTRSQKAQRFRDLHVKGAPLVLYNIWDAGSAQAVVGAGAKAIATGSASLANAHGYADGQDIPFDFLVRIAARIVATSDAPVSIDFEGGFADAPEDCARNLTALAEIGAVGVNFEDQTADGAAIWEIQRHCDRIAALRSVSPDMFLNCRTDLFLKEPDADRHEALLQQAIDRACAYASAGADSFFAPGLRTPGLIAALVEAVDLPVNVMATADRPVIADLAALNVARVSFGPAPYRQALARLAEDCRTATR